MIIRKLEKKDFEEYISLINEFRPIVLDITKEIFETIYDTIFLNSIIFVLEMNDIIVASTTLLIEQKFIHKLSKYGHIEDVIVNNEHRGKGYGKKIIKYVVDYCKKNKFYKITLICKQELIPFYEKNDFQVYQYHLSQLL
jgi:glucosamine-phosphate N-acetyltransferase